MTRDSPTFTTMTPDEAIAFIRPAAGRSGDWADLGAGSGTFTAALAGILGAPHTVAAVERDRKALAEAARLGQPDVVAETTSHYHGTLYCAVLRG
jgi:predicted RNA methylase